MNLYSVEIQADWGNSLYIIYAESEQSALHQAVKANGTAGDWNETKLIDIKPGIIFSK